MFSARTTNKILLKLYGAIISLLRLFTMISISSRKFGFITARNKQVIGTSLNESPQNLATEKKCVVTTICRSHLDCTETV